MLDLRLVDIAKAYGRVQALDGLSLAVEAGEFFCLLGPSAAGKTTTLRTIAGLERPDRGTVAIGGRDVTSAPVQGRNVAQTDGAHRIRQIEEPRREGAIGRLRKLRRRRATQQQRLLTRRRQDGHHQSAATEPPEGAVGACAQALPPCVATDHGWRCRACSLRSATSAL